jgi:hypothetical protein
MARARRMARVRDGFSENGMVMKMAWRMARVRVIDEIEDGNNREPN